MGFTTVENKNMESKLVEKKRSEPFNMTFRWLKSILLTQTSFSNPAVRVHVQMQQSANNAKGMIKKNQQPTSFYFSAHNAKTSYKLNRLCMDFWVSWFTWALYRPPLILKLVPILWASFFHLVTVLLLSLPPTRIWDFLWKQCCRTHQHLLKSDHMHRQGGEKGWEEEEYR